MFRGTVDPVDLHLSIGALSASNVAYRHRTSLILPRGPGPPVAPIAGRCSIVVMIVSIVRR